MNQNNNHIFALIVCGGTGTRLWPKSQPNAPKQFLNIFGRDNLFQKTLKRTEQFIPLERIFFVTGRRYASNILKSNTKIPPQNIICEPDKKHTAAAIALGAAKISHLDPEATIINLWSDHLIKDTETFTKDLNLAGQIAQKGNQIVAVGIKPTFAHTGLGYIEVGNKIAPQIYPVKSFCEKPDKKTAQKYLESGRYYWNLGTYGWHNRLFWQELKKHSPELFRQMEEIKKNLGTAQEWNTISRVYEKIVPISIDCAIAEKTDRMVMVEATFDWRDIGDWQAVWQESAKDNNGNAVLGNRYQRFISIDTKNTLVYSNDKIIAVAGVENFIIVDTDKALLVCPQNQSQKVKELVQLVDEKKHD